VLFCLLRIGVGPKYGTRYQGTHITQTVNCPEGSAEKRPLTDPREILGKWEKEAFCRILERKGHADLVHSDEAMKGTNSTGE